MSFYFSAESASNQEYKPNQEDCAKDALACCHPTVAGGKCCPLWWSTTAQSPGSSVCPTFVSCGALGACLCIGLLSTPNENFPSLLPFLYAFYVFLNGNTVYTTKLTFLLYNAVFHMFIDCPIVIPKRISYPLAVTFCAPSCTSHIQELISMYLVSTYLPKDPSLCFCLVITLVRMNSTILCCVQLDC